MGFKAHARQNRPVTWIFPACSSENFPTGQRQHCFQHIPRVFINIARKKVLCKSVKMDFDEEKDENFIKVKNKLKQDKIKLWLSPYLESYGKKNSNELQKLADSYSEQLNIPKEPCLLLLEKLQTKALKNFNDYNKYLSTGEAALKVKVFFEVGEALLTVVIDLTRMGYDLKLKICRQASVVPHRLRIVFRGKLIDDELSLKDQNIKHGFHIIGIVINADCEGLDLEYAPDGLGEQAISDIVLLSKKGYFQSAEHFKRLSDLQPTERKFLIGGMRLHQIGRAYMKKEDYAAALAMLLEAEENFGHFEPSYLQPYRNYVVLNLDIVWCYMNLQCLLLLPDAEERLRQCEHDFKEAYGANLEKITPETDFHWTALILLMRLHLLQFALLCHGNKTFKAGILMKQTEREIRGLKVNARHLKRLIQLGYSRTESRFALRESRGNFNKAINKIEKKRAEMTKKLFKLVKKGQYLLRSEARGKDPATTRLETALHKCLIGMGFSEEMYKQAMEPKKPTLTEEDDEDEEGSEDSDNENNGNRGIVLKTVITIGFQRKKAKAALKKHGGDYDAAFKDLFKKEFLLGYESYLEFDVDRDDEDEDDTEVSASSNVNDPTRAFSFEFREPVTLTQTTADGTNNIQYDYIDTALKLELTFYQKYKGYLKKIKQLRKTE